MSLLAQDERLTRRVGAVVLVALAAAVLFVVFLLDRIEWGRHVRVHVYMRSTGGLKEGAPLIVAGRPIGTIERIALSPRGATSPLAGDEGVVLTVAIDASAAARVSREGDVFVGSRGVLSERYLELGPPPGVGTPLTDGTQLLGREPPSLDRVLQRTWDNLTTMRQFLAEVSPEVDALRAQLDALVATLGEVSPTAAGLPALGLELSALIAEGRATYAALGGEPGLARLGAMLRRARATLAQARATLAALAPRLDALLASTDALRQRAGDRGGAALAALELAIARGRAAIDALDPLLANLDLVRDRLERGEGSLGRLLTDPEFPEDTKELGKILKRQPWKVIARPKE